MITYLDNIIISLIAALHIYILILEMFLWNTPRARRVFGMTKEQAKLTTINAANQGLYNGFLAAGLIWGLLSSNPEISFQVKIFFLSCIAIAGLYGAKTVHKKIFFIQAAPSLTAIALLLLS